MNEIRKPDWTDTLVPPDAPLRDVVANIENSGMQIALVCDSDRHLLGTVTDGDIRRAILRGESLDGTVDQVMFDSPLVVGHQFDRDTAVNLMRINRIHQIPVVDDNHRLVGLYIWDEVLAPQKFGNSVVIMAGGFGKRLRPFTEDRPKPMLEVGGKPILEHILQRAIAEGFTDFIISLHYLPEVITDYFGDGSRWGVTIRYVYEERPLGTAGALSLIDPPPEKPFVVVNGDVLTEIRLSELLAFHDRHNAAATMTVRQHELANPFGVVKTEGVRIVGFEEKPVYHSHINAGIYVLDPTALAVLRRDEPCDMPHLFERLNQAGRSTIAFPMHEVWIDIGRPDELASADRAAKTT